MLGWTNHKLMGSRFAWYTEDGCHKSSSPREGFSTSYIIWDGKYIWNMLKTHGQTIVWFYNSLWTCNDLNQGYPWSRLKHFKLDTPHQFLSYSQVISLITRHIPRYTSPIWLPFVKCYLILSGFLKMKFCALAHVCEESLINPKKNLSSSRFLMNYRIPWSH